MTVSSEVEDGLAILDYVKSLDFVDHSRIAIHGLSMGGCVASMVAGLRDADVCALSLWCPAPDVVYNMKHKMLCGVDVSDIEEKGYADYEGLRVGMGFYQDALELDPYAVAAKFTKRVNLVHGDEDVTASIHCSERYKEIYGDRAEFLVVHGAEHRFKSLSLIHICSTPRACRDSTTLLKVSACQREKSTCSSSSVSATQRWE